MKGRMILVALAAGIAAFPATTGAQATGEVGGPPSLGAPLDKSDKPTSEAIVIGAGPGPGGRVEIVAQNSKSGLCIFIEHPARQGSGGTCGTFGVPRSIRVMEETFAGARRRANAASTYSGFMPTTVSTVTAVAAQRKKPSKPVRRKTVAGVAAVPGPDILSRLHVSEPFGFFTVEFRGCLIHAKVRVRAFDASGFLLGSGIAFRPHAEPEEIGGFRFVPCSPGSFFDELRFGGIGRGVATARPGLSRISASPGSGATFATAR